MATTKKKPVTKSTAAKPAAARKTTKPARKAPAKTQTKAQKVTADQSFRLTTEKFPFFTFKFTQQSAYWLILSMLVLALGAWVMYLNVQIQSIYDQVQINTELNQDYIVPAIERHHPDAGAPKH